MATVSSRLTGVWPAAATLVLTIAALYLARDVLIPITLSILAAFLLSPLVVRLKRAGVGHTLAVLVVGAAALAVLLALVAIVALELTGFLSALPEYASAIRTKLDGLLAPALRTIGRASHSVREIANGAGEAPSTPSAAPPAGAPDAAALDSLGGALAVVGAPLATFAIVVVLAGAMLLTASDLRDRVIRLIGDGELIITSKALDDAAARVSRYLLVQTLLNGSLGVVIGIGLALIGLPNALMWGLLWGLLRYLPYLGPWLGGGLPILSALALFDGWTQPILVASLIATVELVCNMVLEPWLYASGTGLSPVAVLVSAVFWTWLWGLVGLVLATPLTVCLAVLGRYVERLAFLDVLLGDRPVLRPAVRLYQRFLTDQWDEAREIVAAASAVRPAAELFQELLIPALARVSADVRRGRCDAARAADIHANIRAILVELWPPTAVAASRSRPLGAAAAPACVCLPAHGEDDALCGQMLEIAARGQGLRIECVGTGFVTLEKAEFVAGRRPRVALVSCLSEERVAFLSHTLQRIADRAGDVSLIAGIWHRDSDAPRSGIRDERSGALMVATISEALDAVRLALGPYDADASDAESAAAFDVEPVPGGVR